MTAALLAKPAPMPCSFVGAEGGRLAGTRFGKSAQAVLFLHGGGQTASAWLKAQIAIAADWRSYAVDQRGHGRSDWPASGDYTFMAYGADAAAMARQIAAETGFRPVAVGASLGGISALLAQSDPDDPVFSGLCLVDIVPDMNPDGVDAIQGFMRANIEDGFASVEDAADAVAAYLPHRKRPRSNEGLKRNLRLDADGRWRWHWDPRFVNGPLNVNIRWEEARAGALANAAVLSVPSLLVRGAFSELVSEEAARDFAALAKGMEVADVAKARHMVAGDSNDDFLSAIMQFLGRVRPLPA
jgi:pimeloyl-ACP methyl ester carboxylesterase